MPGKKKDIKPKNSADNKGKNEDVAAIFREALNKFPNTTENDINEALKAATKKRNHQGGK